VGTDSDIDGIHPDEPNVLMASFEFEKPPTYLRAWVEKDDGTVECWLRNESETGPLFNQIQGLPTHSGAEGNYACWAMEPNVPVE